MLRFVQLACCTPESNEASCVNNTSVNKEVHSSGKMVKYLFLNMLIILVF